MEVRKFHVQIKNDTQIGLFIYLNRPRFSGLFKSLIQEKFLHHKIIVALINDLRDFIIVLIFFKVIIVMEVIYKFQKLAKTFFILYYPWGTCYDGIEPIHLNVI